MTVRPATANDISAIVDVHEEAFPGFFLTSLGRAFLSRFYAAVVAERSCNSLVAENGGSIVGFVVGPRQPAGFFRSLLLRGGGGFIVDALPAIARHPFHTARHLLRGLLYRGEGPREYRDAALISSIAVRPSVTGSGTAGVLLEAFCARASDGGNRFVYLTTDRDSNEGANRFYAKHGFACDTQLTRRNGRVMNRYVRDLGPGGGRPVTPEERDVGDR